MPKRSLQKLCTAACIAAAYAALSLVSSAFGLTFGPVQCRFSEALTLLPFLLPEAIPGLFVGCLITNLTSTVGPLDLILGPLATLLSALWTVRMPNRFLAAAPPVLCNAFFIGGMLAWYEGGFGPGFPALFAANALTVAAGEAIACFGLGLPLLKLLERQSAVSPRRS